MILWIMIVKSDIDHDKEFKQKYFLLFLNESLPAETYDL